MYQLLSLMFLFLMLFLTACSNYNISEKAINIRANDHLLRIPIEISSSLLSGKLQTEKLHFDLEEERVLVDIQLSGELKPLWMPVYSGNVRCLISGKPLLDAEQRMVYLADYEIIKLQVVNSRGGTVPLKPELFQFKERLYEVFPRLPIYSLKEHDGLEGMALSSVTAIESHKDYLMLVF